MDRARFILCCSVTLTMLAEMFVPFFLNGYYDRHHHDNNLLITTLSFAMVTLRLTNNFISFYVAFTTRMEELGSFMGRGFNNQEAIDKTARLFQGFFTLILRGAHWLNVLFSTHPERIRIWDFTYINGFFDGLVNLSEIRTRKSLVTNNFLKAELQKSEDLMVQQRAQLRRAFHQNLDRNAQIGRLHQKKIDLRRLLKTEREEKLTRENELIQANKEIGDLREEKTAKENELIEAYFEINRLKREKTEKTAQLALANEHNLRLNQELKDAKKLIAYMDIASAFRIRRYEKKIKNFEELKIHHPQDFS